MASKPMWIVRAGEGGKFIGEFKERSIVAIRFDAQGPLTKEMSREELTRRVSQASPKYNKFKTAHAANQIYRFISEIAVGDWIISYDPRRRVYLVGRVVADLAYEEGGNPELRHYRKVAWENEVGRDSLSVPTKNTLGAIQTLFLLSDSARNEVLKLVNSLPPMST